MKDNRPKNTQLVADTIAHTDYVESTCSENDRTPEEEAVDWEAVLGPRDSPRKDRKSPGWGEYTPTRAPGWEGPISDDDSWIETITAGWPPTTKVNNVSGGADKGDSATTRQLADELADIKAVLVELTEQVSKLTAGKKDT